MKLNIYILSMLLVAALTISGCQKKNSEPEVSGMGRMEIEFDNRVGAEPLVFNTKTYTNAHGDDFTIQTFKYYISNISLTKANGTTVIIPESYYLIDAGDESSTLQDVDGIPAGDYTSIKMTIGVDSARNVSGAQIGALDPVKGMFWNWNNGYIFVKLEGSSSKSTAAAHKLTFHVGGIVAPNNIIRTVSQTFGSTLKIRKNTAPEMHFIVDAASLFRGTTVIDFAKLNSTMGGSNSVIVANNYATGFLRLDHVHN
jgi:hypothetical protein